MWACEMKLACGGRMPESVKLCIQISTPTTPRHHRDEELTMPNVWICKTVCTDQQSVNSSNIENLRIYTTVDTNRPRVSEFMELLIELGRWCVTKKTNVSINRTVAKNRCEIECHNERIVANRSEKHEPEVQNLLNCWHRSARWSQSVKLCANYNVSEHALLRPPKMRDFNKLFANISHRHHKV